MSFVGVGGSPALFLSVCSERLHQVFRAGNDLSNAIRQADYYAQLMAAT